SMPGGNSMTTEILEATDATERNQRITRRNPLQAISVQSAVVLSVKSVAAVVTWAALALAPAALSGQEPVDTAMLAKIREEGLTRSQVLATFNRITNVIGPRLTGSPAFKQAVDWSSGLLKSYGLSDVHLESWPFGRGWTLRKL